MDIERKHFYVTLFTIASIHLYPDNTLAVFTTYLAPPIDLRSASSEWEVGLCEVSYEGTPKGVLISGGLLVDKTIVLVYCDLIAPQFVAEQNLRTLRTIIYSVKGWEHRFQNIYYLPVEKRVFHDINIQMRLMDGAPGPLEADILPVKIVLHFRRVV